MQSGCPPIRFFKRGSRICSSALLVALPSRSGGTTPASAIRRQSWKIPRRLVVKVEWHAGELYPRVGFIVTNMTRPPERVVAFYNQRGTAEQWIKEGKNAVKWTRLSCCSFAANAVRLQLHALAYNLANFMRTLALPEAVKQWSLTSLREKLVKIGAKVVCHSRYVIFQMAEVAVPKELFQEILRLIDGLRPRSAPP
jgi:Transposase DDE domain group 1